MPPALNLPSAAADSYNNLHTKWQANTLDTALTSFWQATTATFPEEIIKNHPVSNWLTVIASLAANMPGGVVPYSDLITAAQYVYRICWMTHALFIQGQINAAQATTGPNSILVQYNATIA
jgi:hypothetical protein